MALCVPAVDAGGKMTVYVHNKPFKGKSMVAKGRLYLSIPDYAAAFSLTVSRNGDAWILNDNAHLKSTCTATSGLCVNGQPVVDALLASGTDTYLAAQPVTRALGGTYLENASMGMIDITVKYIPPPASALDPHESAASSSSGVIMLHWYANW